MWNLEIVPELESQEDQLKVMDDAGSDEHDTINEQYRHPRTIGGLRIF